MLFQRFCVGLRIDGIPTRCLIYIHTQTIQKHTYKFYVPTAEWRRISELVDVIVAPAAAVAVGPKPIYTSAWLLVFIYMYEYVF